MRSTLVLALTTATAVYAQSVPKYESSLNMTISPDSVEPTRRATWCTGQQNTCETLCGDETNLNECDDEKLTWECTCASNNSAPGLQYYTETLPTFICDSLFGQCITQHQDDAVGQSECTKNIKSQCAEQNPPKEPVGGSDEDTTSSATSSTATSSQTPAPNSEDGDNNGDSEENVSTTVSDGLAAPTLVPAANGVAAIAAFGVLAYLV